MPARVHRTVCRCYRDRGFRRPQGAYQSRETHPVARRNRCIPLPSARQPPAPGPPSPPASYACPYRLRAAPGRRWHRTLVCLAARPRLAPRMLLPYLPPVRGGRATCFSYSWARSAFSARRIQPTTSMPSPRVAKMASKPCLNMVWSFARRARTAIAALLPDDQGPYLERSTWRSPQGSIVVVSVNYTPGVFVTFASSDPKGVGD